MELYAARSRALEAHRVKNVPVRYADFKLGDVSLIPPDSVMRYQAVCKTVKHLLERPGIMALIGEPGSGKTAIGCALVNSACDSCQSAHFTKAARYISAIRETWSNAAKTEDQIERYYSHFTLLVIDELTVRMNSETENLCLFRLIDRRYDAEKATLLIGNYSTLEEFEQLTDRRIIDRLNDDCGGVLCCNWNSLRGRIERHTR